MEVWYYNNILWRALAFTAVFAAVVTCLARDEPESVDYLYGF